VVAGDTAYVVAGWTGSIANPKLQKGLLAYNFVTGTWTTTGLANAPPPRLTCGAISMPDGKIYLIAGGSAKGNILWETNRVDIYDTATNTWSSGPSLPAPVGAHVALVAGDTLYVLGGSRVEDTSLADVWALTLT
jgi:N-acetylneuraminic acid mutarotase